MNKTVKRVNGVLTEGIESNGKFKATRILSTNPSDFLPKMNG